MTGDDNSQPPDQPDNDPDVEISPNVFVIVYHPITVNVTVRDNEVDVGGRGEKS